MRVLILGMGRSGVSLARYLLSRGAEVLAYDDNPRVFQSDSLVSLLKDSSFRVQAEVTRVVADFAVASPGIPDEALVIQNLRARNIRVIDEVEFGYEIVGKRIVAVTGTNGKSTTTALLGEMLRAAGRSIFYGGNLAPGMPFSSALLESPKELYVIEVSSFQLERCQHFAPRVALLLNIAEDHLNRHHSMEHYQQLKLSIFRNQTADDFAIVNSDDPRIRDNTGTIRARVVTFSLRDPKADAALHNGTLVFRDEPIMAAREIRLPGQHNVANALAALAGARILGVGKEHIAQVLRAFQGLEHRLELVVEKDGVRYVNNSMCTNPAAAIHSLEAFDQPVILITGGREKELPINGYLSAIKNRARVAILVGENRRRLLDLLKAIGYEQARVAESLPEAVHEARELGQSGDFVLFSPGFASFDEYADFQERGRAFKEAVRREVTGSRSESGQ